MRKFILLVLLQALMAGAAFAQAKPAARATEAEAKAFAEKAIAHIKAVGAEKAYADFNARTASGQTANSMSSSSRSTAPCACTAL